MYAFYTYSQGLFTITIRTVLFEEYLDWESLDWKKASKSGMGTLGDLLKGAAKKK